MLSHVTLIGATFFDKKGRLIHYIVSPTKERAKEVILQLRGAGINAYALVRYTQIKRPGFKPQMVWKPVYIIYLTPFRVLYKLHRRWYENPKTLWRKK